MDPRRPLSDSFDGMAKSGGNSDPQYDQSRLSAFRPIGRD